MMKMKNKVVKVFFNFWRNFSEIYLEIKKEIVEVDENGVSKKSESKENKKGKITEKVDDNDKLNPKQVEEIRKALGDACFGEDDLSDGSDDWVGYTYFL